MKPPEVSDETTIPAEEGCFEKSEPEQRKAKNGRKKRKDNKKQKRTQRARIPKDVVMIKRTQGKSFADVLKGVNGITASTDAEAKINVVKMTRSSEVLVKLTNEKVHAKVTDTSDPIHDRSDGNR